MPSEPVRKVPSVIFRQVQDGQPNFVNLIWNQPTQTLCRYNIDCFGEGHGLSRL